MTRIHASNTFAHSLEHVALDGELTGTQAAHKSAQILDPDMIGWSVFFAIATTPTFGSKVVVTQISKAG